MSIMPPPPPQPPVSPLQRFEDERAAVRADLKYLVAALKDGHITAREYGLRSDDLHARLFDLQRAIETEQRSLKLQVAKSVLQLHNATLAFGDAITETIRPLPEEDHFGETLAYRVWRLHTVGADIVTSCYRSDYYWMPRQIEQAQGMTDRNGLGFHAWSNSNSAVGYAMSLGPGIVIGRVKLWGIVVHHQRGYRGEFAKITGFDYLIERGSLYDDEKLAQLRHVYGVEERTP